MEGESRQVISFEDFELDGSLRQLRKNGEIIQINARTFDLLTFLVENNDRLLTKEEILDGVWSGQFVEEANLSVQVSALRKALGEDKDSPRFLVTVPGKGYKFVAEVKKADSPSAVPSNVFGQTEERLKSGTKIGSYEIGEEIGRGGMGEVFLANDTRLGRQVALKLLAAKIAGEEDRVGRFRQEAFAASALNHPNIVTIYETGVWHGRDFIVTEFVDGETLRKRLGKGFLPLGEALDIALQTSSGLAAAHDAGVIHRDIKPENIMIRDEGLVKLLDFGIAKYRPQSERGFELVETRLGEVIGTAAYMSPEQARGQPVDARTDVWSLGVILYEMIEGTLPFSGETKPDRIAAILEHEPPPFERKNIPPLLEKAVFRALCKDSNERHRDMEEFARELDAVRVELGDDIPGVRLPVKKNRASAAFAGIAVSALLAIAATFLYFGGFVPFKDPGPLATGQRLVSTFSGSHAEAAFSPDGKSIAFVSEDGEGIRQIWTVDTLGGEPKKITTEIKFARRPRWAPNGTGMLFYRGGNKGDEICYLPDGSNVPVKIIAGGRNPNWSRDGKKIVFERGFDIWTANSDGSGQRRVDGVPQTDILWSDRMPAFSPDGGRIVFFQNDKGPMGDYFVIPAAGGNPKRLTNDRAFGGAPVWTGEHIIFPSRRGGSTTIWRVNAEGGGTPEAVLNSAGEDTEPDISTDRRRLIYTNTRKTYSLVMGDGSVEPEILREGRLHIVHPDVSPDASRVAFFGVDERGDAQIFTVAADSGGIVKVTTGEGEENIHPQWSMDGKSIYYYRAHPDRSFRMIPASGGESRELVSGWGWGTHNHARVDPLGEKIIYTKMDRGRPVATMIRDILTGKETAFGETLRQVRWSRDGKHVAGTDLAAGGYERAEIVVCEVANEACQRIARGYRPEWSADGTKVYFQRQGAGGGHSIWQAGRNGGAERKVLDLRPIDPMGPFYSVTAGGGIVWVRYEQGRSELWMADIVGPL